MTVDEVRVVVAGAGLRGIGYARRAVASGSARVVAVAEPDPVRRAGFATEFAVPADRVFTDWSQLSAAGRLGDAVVIATQDHMHADAAVAFAQLGYHILLEKPMATTESDAVRISSAVAKAGVIFAVCHVLRYTPYTQSLKRLLDGRTIGRLINIQHLEPIGWWHHAHSFVRGHWNNTATSGPLLLTKACHDIDWLLYLFEAVPSRISSFGGLAHFRPEHRPPGAAARCLDCPVEPQCPYSAPRLYLSCLGDPAREFWPLSAVTADHTPAGVENALRDGPYGRCVYDGDNNVVDHQVVAMEFPDGATCSFTMTAFTPKEHRRTRLSGTHGHIDGDGRILRVTDFRTGSEQVIDTGVAAVAEGDPTLLRSDAVTSLASHRVVWAAEQARTAGTIISFHPRIEHI